MFKLFKSFNWELPQRNYCCSISSSLECIFIWIEITCSFERWWCRTWSWGHPGWWGSPTRPRPCCCSRCCRWTAHHPSRRKAPRCPWGSGRRGPLRTKSRKAGFGFSCRLRTIVRDEVKLASIIHQAVKATNCYIKSCSSEFLDHSPTKGKVSCKKSHLPKSIGPDRLSKCMVCLAPKWLPPGARFACWPH